MSHYIPPPNRPNPHARFDRRVSKPTMHPRRVVGGVRLQSKIAPILAASSDPASAPPVQSAGWTWASNRWMRVAEMNAPGDQLAEGLEYAQSGQARTLELRPTGGLIQAKVQGRMPSAYKTALRLPTFTTEQWETVIASMSQQAKYAAAILSGELPSNIEDLFAPHGLKLFPADPIDLSPSCNCSVFTGIEPMTAPLPPLNPWQDVSTVPAPPVEAAPPPPPEPPEPRRPGVPWCKHVCCLMYLIADRLGQQPLLILSLRGMADSDLVERLRQARALQGMNRSAAGGAGSSGTVGANAGTGGAVPVYSPHVPVADRAAGPLPALAHEFWHASDPDALDELDCPIAPPELSHPLLRRLGSSPFAGAKFPLVGLLATCYDVISQAAISNESGASGPLDAADPEQADKGDADSA